MKNLAMLGGAALILLLSPVAAYADCRNTCGGYCGQAHPSNPEARAICYNGCMAGCTIGPIEVEP